MKTSRDRGGQLLAQSRLNRLCPREVSCNLWDSRQISYETHVLNLSAEAQMWPFRGGITLGRRSMPAIDRRSHSASGELGREHCALTPQVALGAGDRTGRAIGVGRRQSMQVLCDGFVRGWA